MTGAGPVAIFVEPQQTAEGQVGESTEWLVRDYICGYISLTRDFAFELMICLSQRILLVTYNFIQNTTQFPLN